MADRQRKLYEFLLERERGKMNFTIGDVMEATGLSEASVKAYISKKLRGLWIDPVDSYFYRATGLSAISLADFRGWMSQTTAGLFGPPQLWRIHLMGVLHIGARAGHPVREIVEELMASLPQSTEPSDNAK